MPDETATPGGTPEAQDIRKLLAETGDPTLEERRKLIDDLEETGLGRPLLYRIPTYNHTIEEANRSDLQRVENGAETIKLGHALPLADDELRQLILCMDGSVYIIEPRIFEKISTESQMHYRSELRRAFAAGSDDDVRSLLYVPTAQDDENARNLKFLATLEHFPSMYGFNILNATAHHDEFMQAFQTAVEVAQRRKEILDRQKEEQTKAQLDMLRKIVGK